MVGLTEAASNIQIFEKSSLGSQIASIENNLRGADKKTCEAYYSAANVTPVLLESALEIKRTVGQINVIVHAVGILLSLPYLLDENEKIEYLSLGAGNTGKPFDLETNERVAEFKFTYWKGGSESIRQNQLFKDFYLLAEFKTSKKRYLYVVDKKYPLKFLQGGRTLSSVMSRNIKLWTEFQKGYGGRFSKVREYFDYKKPYVQVEELKHILNFVDGSDLTEDENELI